MGKNWKRAMRRADERYEAKKEVKPQSLRGLLIFGAFVLAFIAIIAFSKGCMVSEGCELQLARSYCERFGSGTPINLSWDWIWDNTSIKVWCGDGSVEYWVDVPRTEYEQCNEVD